MLLVSEELVGPGEVLCCVVFLVFSSHPFPESIFELAKVEVKGCKDAVKLLASINV